MVEALIAVHEKGVEQELRSFFEQSGCDVRVAQTGLKAQEICNERKIDLLISEGHPSDGVTGLELAEAVKKKNSQTNWNRTRTGSHS